MKCIKQAIKKWVCKDRNFAASQNISDINQFYGQYEFEELKKTILIWIKNRSRDEQIVLLDYIVDMLKEDLCSGNAAKVLMNPFSSPFIRHKIKSGEKIKQIKIEEEKHNEHLFKIIR